MAKQTFKTPDSLKRQIGMPEDIPIWVVIGRAAYHCKYTKSYEYEKP